MKTITQHLNKARLEAERLTDLWWATHPEEKEQEYYEKCLADFQEAGKLRHVIMQWCNAHSTGNPCKCHRHPQWAEAHECMAPAEHSLRLMESVRAILRSSINYRYRTMLERAVYAKDKYERRPLT